MKRLMPLLALCLAFALTSARAQHPMHADSAHADTMERMLEMHEHFMSDSLYRAHLMADTSMQASMHALMGSEVAAMHEQMAAMSHAERMAMMQQMHAHMIEQAGAMSPGERAAFHARMMEAHERAMADPELHERMMADPEMREMMERMHEAGMMHHEREEDHHDEMHNKGGHEDMHGGTDG